MKRATKRNELEMLRRRLLTRRQSMVAEVRRAVAGSRAGLDVADPGDESDQAVASLARETELALAQIESAEVEQIDEALRLLDEGGYGRCGVCGRGIPSRRLRIMPFATLCARCQEEEETQASARPNVESGTWARVENIAEDAPEREKYLEELEREVEEPVI